MKCIYQIDNEWCTMGANYTVQPYYPYMGRGSIRSLFILVWEVLHQIFMEGLHGRILLDQVDSTNPASGMGRTRGAGAGIPYPGL
jgi:hypothetical protein